VRIKPYLGRYKIGATCAPSGAPSMDIGDATAKLLRDKNSTMFKTGG
jgi:hypothetical protein